MSFLTSLFKKKAEADISSILPDELYEASALDLKDVIAPSALKITPRELNLGDKIVRSFFVISYPRYLNESWFSPIINLDKILTSRFSSTQLKPQKSSAIFRKKLPRCKARFTRGKKKGLCATRCSLRPIKTLKSSAMISR